MKKFLLLILLSIITTQQTTESSAKKSVSFDKQSLSSPIVNKVKKPSRFRTAITSTDEALRILKLHKNHTKNELDNSYFNQKQPQKNQINQYNDDEYNEHITSQANALDAYEFLLKKLQKNEYFLKHVDEIKELLTTLNIDTAKYSDIINNHTHDQKPINQKMIEMLKKIQDKYNETIYLYNNKKISENSYEAIKDAYENLSTVYFSIFQQYIYNDPIYHINQSLLILNINPDNSQKEITQDLQQVLQKIKQQRNNNQLTPKRYAKLESHYYCLANFFQMPQDDNLIEELQQLINLKNQPSPITAQVDLNKFQSDISPCKYAAMLETINNFFNYNENLPDINNTNSQRIENPKSLLETTLPSSFEATQKSAYDLERINDSPTKKQSPSQKKSYSNMFSSLSSNNIVDDSDSLYENESNQSQPVKRHNEATQKKTKASSYSEDISPDGGIFLPTHNEALSILNLTSDSSYNELKSMLFKKYIPYQKFKAEDEIGYKDVHKNDKLKHAYEVLAFSYYNKNPRLAVEEVGVWFQDSVTWENVTTIHRNNKKTLIIDPLEEYIISIAFDFLKKYFTTHSITNLELH